VNFVLVTSVITFMQKSIDELVEDAKSGNKSALEELIARIQNRVYGLGVRMLWHPEDAKDATQEILIRVVTNLGDFRGGSAFTTWVYQIATNYLLTTRQRKAEREAMTFDRFSEDLDEGLSDEPLQYLEAEQKLLLE
jgi:RNA polymerase sigma factor (sigma-70 family)